MKIRVRKTWLDLCGRDPEQDVFVVESVSDHSMQTNNPFFEKMYQVTDPEFPGHHWVVAQGRVEEVINEE